jgi:endoglucanase
MEAFAMKKRNLFVFFLVGLLMVFRGPANSVAEPAPIFKLNAQQYFEAPGLSLLVFHDFYPEGKQGGLEIIQHGQRVATNGDLRVEVLPWQWSGFPRIGPREVNPAGNEATVSLSYPELDYKVRVRAEGNAFRVIVDMAKPLEAKWAGKGSFILELFPVAYFGKSFYLGDTFGVFPRQPDGSDVPIPLAVGKRLSLAPEDPAVRMEIEAVKGELKLYDGRDKDQTGWFVVRSEIPVGAAVGAVEWIIRPHVIKGWVRDPVIAYSQIGYHPDQIKQAILEFDPQTKSYTPATLYRINPDGTKREILSVVPKKWGKFLRYEYAVFDFTSIHEPGMYVITYANQSTLPFPIGREVFQKDIWQPTLEIFFPVQMCHMRIRDRFRVWHGACHLDDALQAPTSHTHFDGYSQGPSTDTPYKPYAHIPFLDRGGWHDAGDYDLAAGSQASTVFTLVLAREAFGVNIDQTRVNPDSRLVVLHTPDGVPDIVQQIEHGVENLLSGYRAAGHSFAGIIEETFQQYVHNGDASTITDNRVYDPACDKENPVTGETWGHRDDRFAFTNRDSGLEYRCVQVLAAAGRVLRGYNDKLADECLKTAQKTWTYEQTHPSVSYGNAYVPGNPEYHEVVAAIELFITTKDPVYRKKITDLMPRIEKNLAGFAVPLIRVLPLLKEDGLKLKLKLRKVLEPAGKELKASLAGNPFGVPFGPHIWGIGWSIQDYAVDQYYLAKTFPDLYGRENVLRVVNFVLGCHPGSNVSFVSGVGARSLTIAYGANRGDWSYIPGGMASGVALIRPDFPELKDSYPFLWQQAEYVMPGAATYLFCVLASDQLLNQKP